MPAASTIRDLSLAPEGERKIGWVASHSHTLNALKRSCLDDGSLRGRRIALAIHLEAKTAYLAWLFQEAGAEVTVTGSNPFSTQDDVAAALLLSYFVVGIQTASAGGLDDKLPALDGLVRYGCSVQGPIQQLDHGDPSGRTRPVWSVTFWAEHISAFGKKARKDWKLLYSFRKKRCKGLTDCDKFMARVSKATREQPSRSTDFLAAQRNLDGSN